MRRLRYFDEAIDDLLQIERYIAAESGDEDIAVRFTKKLQAQCRKLAELPGQLGRPRPEIRDGIRSIPFGNYIIFFRYDDPYFYVISIIEGHRDIDSVF